ncbi:MAG: GGDEF domain-containing protein [Lachnospiraceae bacterium]|nr:GGDEF domain-containing protein [Lachnospiraceae bacterium]
MIKKTIEYINQKQFENSLDLYKQRILERFKYDDISMYFHIFSTELREDEVRPVWECIERIFPGKPWVGHSTAGNVSDCEITSEMSVTITVFEKETTKFKINQYSMSKQATKDIAMDIIKVCENNPWVKAVEFYRTINSESPNVFSEEFDCLREDIQMFGSIVCSKDITSTDSCVFSSVGGFDTTGLLVLFFGGEDFHVNSFKVSGWQPIGRTFVVTKAKGCTIYELDGKPAYNVYKKYLRIENDENLFVNALEFPMMFERDGIRIVRAAAAGNEDGSLVMSANVEEGTIVRLSYGEPDTIMDAVREAAKEISDFNAELLHIFYCTARKVFWGMDEPTTEIYPFRYVKGSAGFFSHGEFLREKGSLNQHSVTLVLAAMREGEGKKGKNSVVFEERITSTKLPLASRMATFIRETVFELETTNSQLKFYNDQLKGIAKTDGLTGLKNRLAFDELLKEIENEKIHDKDWAMLMIDLNGLKATNDQYGHEAGDELIKGTATVISDIYADKGECFRIGGDEFVVIIDASEEQMLEYRNKLKARMDEYNRVETYKLSMAVGESRLNNPDGVRGSISDWKMNADMDMYREKDGFHKATRRILYANIN